MICPECGREGMKEWKHCARLHEVVCAECCRRCEYMDKNSTMGGIMCKWIGKRLTAEEEKELNLLNIKIKRIRNAMKMNSRMGWPTGEQEAQLIVLNKKLAEMKGERRWEH